LRTNIKADRSVHACIVTKHNSFINTPTSTLQAEHKNTTTIMTLFGNHNLELAGAIYSSH